MDSATYELTDTTVTRRISGTTATAPLDRFVGELGMHTPLDTGLLPPGVRAIRRYGDHHQLVLEVAPGINKVLWGEREGGPAPMYELAQPWVIGIADFVNNNFLGCRMFYAYHQVSDESDPLYVINLPNLNWRGYHGNGVGWVCYYLTGNTTQMSVAEQALYVMKRMSGMEAYNNRNMSETDGPRYYQAAGKPRYTWDPGSWDKKSLKEGLDWVFERDLWIPVTVQSIDDQSRITPGGVQLTLGMAMYGSAAAYYSDRYHPKPINALRRGMPVTDLAQKTIHPAFTAAAAAAPPTTRRSRTTVSTKE